MEKLKVGSVVAVHFPFSDLSGTKIRPALVISDVGRNDYILCQITSKEYGDSKAIPLTAGNFIEGSLPRKSYIRPGKIFTANSMIISSIIGDLKKDYFSSVIEKVIAIIRGI